MAVTEGQTRVGEMWRHPPLVHCGGEGGGRGRDTEWGSSCGKQFGKQFLRRLDLDLPHDSAVLHVGILPTEVPTGTQRDASAQMFTATVCTTVQRGGQPPNVRGEWRNKAWFILTTEWYSLNVRGLSVSGILLSHEKE